jgi:AraC-like DNA-binding protein
MFVDKKINLKVDPSGIKQYFVKADLHVHCCRYWKLSEWEYDDLSLSFWRLYYNSIPGASVHYKNKAISLDTSRVLIIPPYTSFSTSLKNRGVEGFKGSRIESLNELEKLEGEGMVDHLFIHFNLGIQFDHVKPAIYWLDKNSNLMPLIDSIRFKTIADPEVFDHAISVNIYALIMHLLSSINKNSWQVRTNDNRVLKTIDYIDRNYHQSLANNILAEKVNMATNSFLRLFKQNMGLTIQQYLQQVRINKAIIEMHNKNSSIESIASKCGFSDRHHFSKVFKRNIGIPPALYRQQKIYF